MQRRLCRYHLSVADELELLPRRALAEIRAALADTRVVTINGARQVGKSTLAEVVVGSMPVRGYGP